MGLKSNYDLPAVPLPFALGTIVLLSLCFVNSYDGEFVFDDSEAIINNDDVKDTPLWDIFKNDFWGTKLSHNQSHKSYRPLTILTFRMHFWFREKLVPQDFHIVNIVLHTIICVLTFFVFNTLLGSNGENISFYASVLFAVHPIHTEAVAGIVGRAELLCALFTWLAILLYSSGIYARRLIHKFVYTCTSFICISVATFCKETGITAVGICAIYDLVVVNNVFPIDAVHFLKVAHSYKDVANVIKSRRAMSHRLFLLTLIAVILLSVRFGVMGFRTPTFQIVDNPASFMDSFFSRILNYSYIYYLNMWLLICPEWLCFDWSMGCVPLIHGYDKRIFAVLVFCIMLGTIMLRTFDTDKNMYLRHTIMGLVLLVVPFLPASNIFLKVGFVLAERTLYIPSAGYCLLFVSGLQRLYLRFPVQKVLLMSFTVVVIIFSARTWTRNNEWRTEKLLFRSALSVCPLNAKVHYNIAKTAADAGDSELAKLEYEEALRLNPNYAQAMNNLGNLFRNQGQYEAAAGLFKKAIKLQKNFATAWMNLGIVFSAMHNYAEAENSYLTALSYRSKYPDCYYNLGLLVRCGSLDYKKSGYPFNLTIFTYCTPCIQTRLLYLQRKDYAKAINAWTNATRLQPSHKHAWANMILLLDNIGMSEEALKTANEALQFIPDYALIYFNIANLLGKAGKFVSAEEHFKKALSRDSKNPIYYTNLGVLYHRWNKFDEAEMMYKKALEINPMLHSAKDNLKKLYSLKSSIK